MFLNLYFSCISCYSAIMYRLTAGCVVVNQGKIFVGLKKGGYWNMPQGGIEEGETAREGAERELLEETGITKVEWTAETDWYLCHVPKAVETRRYTGLLGQKHKWYLCFCVSEPQVILCEEEYTTYEWVSREEVLQRIAGSFKESLYNYIFSKFDKFLQD